MDGAFSAYGVGERLVRVSGGGNLRESEGWVEPGVDERIILRWVFRKWDVGLWTGSSWLRIGRFGGHL